MANHKKHQEDTNASAAPALHQELRHSVGKVSHHIPTEEIVKTPAGEPVILFFDEGDNLFGKRSAVEGSHEKRCKP